VVIEAALRLNFGSEVENLANLVLSVSALGIHKGLHDALALRLTESTSRLRVSAFRTE
jgi:hypothetical protein